MHVRDVETGKDLPDRVPWCKFGDIVWEKGSRGFFYSAFPPPKTLQVRKTQGMIDWPRLRYLLKMELFNIYTSTVYKIG